MICKVKFWKQIGEIIMDWECKSLTTVISLGHFLS